MKLWQFEGTPEEFRAVSDALMGSANGASSSTGPALSSPLTALGTRPVSLDEAKKVLTRLELSDAMLNVLKELYKHKDKRLTSQELRNVNHHNADQFRGLMGAFGRRVVNTVPAKAVFLDQEWNAATGQYTWTLPDAVRQALEELKLV